VRARPRRGALLADGRRRSGEGAVGADGARSGELQRDGGVDDLRAGQQISQARWPRSRASGRSAKAASSARITASVPSALVAADRREVDGGGTSATAKMALRFIPAQVGAGRRVESRMVRSPKIRFPSDRPGAEQRIGAEQERGGEEHEGDGRVGAGAGQDQRDGQQEISQPGGDAPAHLGRRIGRRSLTRRFCVHL